MVKNQKKIWDILYKKGLNWKKTNKIQEKLKCKLVLELGVGNGKSLKHILEQNPQHVVAIDISEEAINLAKKSVISNKVSYISQDFMKYRSNKKFDAIVCYYFLNNFKERERKKAVENMKGMLKDEGIILFEDFAFGDLRENGNEIEKNTIEKQNGLICHFFTIQEIKDLFNGFEVKIKEKTFNPIRKDKNVQRKIISAKILRTR